MHAGAGKSGELGRITAGDCRAHRRIPIRCAQLFELWADAWQAHHVDGCSGVISMQQRIEFVACPSTLERRVQLVDDPFWMRTQRRPCGINVEPIGQQIRPLVRAALGNAAETGVDESGGAGCPDRPRQTDRFRDGRVHTRAGLEQLIRTEFENSSNGGVDALEWAR